MSAPASARRAARRLPPAPDALLGPYLVTDGRGAVRAWNAPAEALLGDGLGGATLGGLADLASRPAVASALEAAGRGLAAEVAVRLRPPDRPPADAVLAGAALPAPATGLAWVVRPLARPAGDWDALPGETATLAAIVEGIPAGLILVSVPGGELVIANRHARLTLGFDLPLEASLAGYPEHRMYDLDGRQLERAELPVERAARGETVASERIWVVRGDGTRVALELHAAPLRAPDGRILAAVAVFQDVTAQEELQRAAADFITNAAHELRTPIAAIASSVEVLERGAKFRAADRDHFLGHIERETARLVRLTHALLVLARAQSRVEAPRLEIVDVEPLLKEVASGLRPADGVRVLVRASPQAAVLANRGLLEQAVSALAANAARFTGSGRIVLSARRRRAELLVTVRDTGPGMTAEQLAEAGRRFARGGSPDAGFGLGLAIARQAVAAMGGTLALESEPGAGTTGTIALPGARLVAR